MGKVTWKIMLCFYFVLVTVKFYDAQNLQIAYEVKFKPKKGVDSTLLEQTLLQINLNQKESFYQSNNKIKYDSLTTVINTLGNSPAGNALISALPNFNFNHIIYKDFNKNKSMISEVVMGQWFSADFKFSPNWNLKNDTKMIQGYNCYSATIEFGGRIWTAWYTSKIPIQDGPYKFYGLPGLILEISSSDGDYHFTAIGIENGNYKATEVKTVKLTTQQLNRLKSKTAEDPSSQLKQIMNSPKGGSSLNVIFEGQESTRSDTQFYDRVNAEYWSWMKNHNNPIEKDDIWIK